MSSIVIDPKFKTKILLPTADGVETIEVKSDMLVELATFLKMSKDTQFDLLLSVSGVDTAEGFEVVYHLASTVFNKKLVLKVKLSKSCPEVCSLSCLYSAANWHERETYDLFGINFLNHPDLTRLLLPNDWKGYPLRKDYVQDDERLVWNER